MGFKLFNEKESKSSQLSKKGGSLEVLCGIMTVN